MGSERTRALAVTAASAALVLSPLVREATESTDDFPLSHYPMFSASGIGHEVEVSSVRLVARGGEERPAPLAWVGSPEPMVAKNIVRDAISRGEAERLCGAVRAKADGDVVSVRVVTATFDARTYFDGRAPRGREPIRRVVHAQCAAERARP